MEEKTDQKTDKKRQWIQAGDCGHDLCVNCTLPLHPEFNPDDHCFGCPQAWRRVNDKIQYWRQPIHEFASA